MTIADNAGLNDKIRGLQNASAADFYTPYVGAAGEKAIGFEFSNHHGSEHDFYPAGSGHAGICCDPVLGDALLRRRQRDFQCLYRYRPRTAI